MENKTCMIGIRVPEKEKNYRESGTEIFEKCIRIIVDW